MKTKSVAYGYDSYGNLVRKRIDDEDGTFDRSARTVYDVGTRAWPRLDSRATRGPP